MAADWDYQVLVTDNTGTYHEVPCQAEGMACTINVNTFMVAPFSLVKDHYVEAKIMAINEATE